MGPYLGDYKKDANLDYMWDTNNKSGASISRSVDGTIAVYKGNGTEQSTAGITDTENFDSPPLTGIHHLRIDLSSDAFYATGNDYNVVLQGATIDSESVNAVICSFSIENRSVQEVIDMLPTKAKLTGTSNSDGVIDSDGKDAVAESLADSDIKSSLQNIQPNSIIDIMMPVVADTFQAAGGATSQLFEALGTNTSFNTGEQYAVIFSDLEASGDDQPARHGDEFLGSVILAENAGRPGYWQILGGYCTDFEAGSPTPQIVTYSKFGVCKNMADSDWFQDNSAGGNWNGQTDNNGEAGRSEGGWTFVVKQVQNYLGIPITFPVSNDNLSIRSMVGAVTTGSGSEDVNVVSISGSTSAADNVEAVFTGSGDTAGVDITMRRLVINNDTVNPAVEINSTAADGVRIDVQGTNNAILASSASDAVVLQGGMGENAGRGLVITSYGANKPAVHIQATGSTSEGIKVESTLSGDGIHISTTSGHGVYMQGNDTNKYGLYIDSDDDTAVYITNGANYGVYINSGYYDGMYIVGSPGLRIESSAGDTDAVKFEAKSNNGSALKLIGSGTKHGLDIVAGSTGKGISVVTTSGDAVYLEANANGHGINISAGVRGINIVSMSDGVKIAATGLGIYVDSGLQCVKLEAPDAATESLWCTGAVVLQGAGANDSKSLEIIQGVYCGNASGDAVNIDSEGGNGVKIAGSGSGHGLEIIAGATGDGVKISTTDGDGISFSIGGSGKIDINAPDLVDLIWDESQSEHTDPDTFGKYLDTEVSGVGSDATLAKQTEILTNLANVPDAVWDENVITDHTSNDMAGRLLADVKRTLMNRMEIEMEGEFTYLNIYDDAGSEIKYQWKLTDINDSPAVITGTGPAKRGTQSGG